MSKHIHNYRNSTKNGNVLSEHNLILGNTYVCMYTYVSYSQEM